MSRLVEPDAEWIPINQRRPTQTDADMSGCVHFANSSGTWPFYKWSRIPEGVTHWRPTGIDALPSSPKLECWVTVDQYGLFGMVYPNRQEAERRVEHGWRVVHFREVTNGE